MSIDLGLGVTTVYKMTSRRALHFVFKIPNRKDALKFYTQVLGMKVLRHEEFDEGCKALCNGPYDGKWSKTMIGYGPEDNHFVVELTYNYGISSYKLGNDFLALTVNSSAAISNAEEHTWPILEENEEKILVAPGGYPFFICDETQTPNTDPVKKVSLACSNLKKSVEFWNTLLGMDILNKNDKFALLGYGSDQCKLELRDIGTSINHEKAFGRIAFSCPTKELESIQAKVKDAGYKILTPLVSLDTPGKATVHVVIIADPDDHEICFVGDEAFRELSHVDSNAETLLKEAIAKDDSDEWYAKKGRTKPEA